MTEYVEQEQNDVLAMPDQAEARASFIVRTYTHLFGAVVAFTLIEVLLFTSGLAYHIARAFLSTNWLVILGGFMIVSWIASRTAHRAEGKATQYAGLLLFILAEALIFVPLLAVAEYYAPGVIRSAALVTLFGFTGLTLVAVWTRKDFSFLGGMLRWGMVLALVAIVGGVIFGFELGTWFSVAMIGLAGAAILYDTSKILTVFPTDRHVGAALELFASVALMFWYVLRLFMSRR
jgi:FtsH-binding integral membrane protein